MNQVALILISILIVVIILLIIINLKRKNKNVSLTQKNKVFNIASIFTNTQIDDNFFANLENTLISADVGVITTKEIISNLRSALRDDKIKTPNEAKEKLKEILLNIFKKETLNINGKNILFVVGVNGVGKTTTIAKLANLIKKENPKIILGACDTFRAAAIEQLETWANRLNIKIVKGQQAGDPSAVLFATLEKAVKEDIDTVIIDTAGRFHNQDNLIRQLEKMKKISSERFPNYNFRTILILDGNVGHNGIEQANVFLKSLDVSGVIVTKLDGSCKGGVSIGIAHNLKLPIYYIGYGEKVDDFKTFNSNEFVDSILD